MEISKTLREVLQGCPGAATLFLTDRDGVIVLTVGDEQRSRQALIASQQGTNDQTSKLVMGAHRASVFFYEHTQLVILALPPLTAYIIAKPESNTGQLMKLREKLEPLLQQIEAAVPGIPGGQRV